MALSKKVQRSLDPNNKHWAEDKSRFGYRLLQKYGWDEGKGLGVNEDGSTTHIKVTQKADTRGVGSPDVVDPWLQNTSSYNNVLARLASIAGSTPPPKEPTTTTASLFVQSTESYTTTESPTPKHFLPPRVKKHKLARYSEEEMRGIFVSSTLPTPSSETPQTRFSNATPSEEIDQFTVTSTMSIFDYFASKKKTDPADEPPGTEAEKSEIEPSENIKKRKREDSECKDEDETKEEKKKRKKKKKSSDDEVEDGWKVEVEKSTVEASVNNEEDQIAKKKKEEKKARKKEKKDKKEKKAEKKEKRKE